MLRINDLSFRYSKKHPLISGFNMSLDAGTVCGLLGKNGAGKSTLIYLICGLLRPDNGTIDFEGYTPIDRKTPFLEEIFLVPEEFNLPKVSLEDYLKVNAPFYPRFSEDAIRKYLDIFELEPDQNLGALSMGQKKKAFISFAMACNTRLLILDEPTNGLDISAKMNFRKAVMECMDDDKSILISTHQVYDVEKILDHVMIMDRKGVLLDESMMTVSERLRFNFTTDRERASRAMLSLDVPGGINIVEAADADNPETDVNLESLFLLAQNRPDIIASTFRKS